jgi:hypothetical protein
MLREESYLISNANLLVSITCVTLAGYLQMYRYFSFVVTSSADGESRHVYGDLYTIGGYSERYFFPIWVVA